MVDLNDLIPVSMTGAQWAAVCGALQYIAEATQDQQFIDAMEEIADGVEAWLEGREVVRLDG